MENTLKTVDDLLGDITADLGQEKLEENNSEEETMEERFAKERLEWNLKIKNMSSSLSNLNKVSELMTSVYTERQLGLEYYHYLISLLVALNKKYNKLYSDKWAFYTYQSQERFPNETAKNMKISSELGELKKKREMIENHSKFIDGTVRTIDNIIYGIKYKIEIFKLSNGR